jgi:hypothetical protein
MSGRSAAHSPPPAVAAAELAEAAALAALKQLPEYALAASPFGLLDNRGSLRLVTDTVHEGDALCLALTCRALRDALWARFPARRTSGTRVCTRDAAVVGTVGRLAWARGLDQPWPEPREDWQPSEICETAARHGALASLQWARANGCEWSADTCTSAAYHGYLVVLQWARANGCDWGVDTCTAAAQAGHLSVLQWARANGCEWNADTCSNAAGGGHLEVLQWARANDCDWDSRTCSEAAYGGHIAVLQWARANGCDWNARMCCAAAWGGHLEVLQWARANGCDWDMNTCRFAAEGGHLGVLQWARANGCDWDARTCRFAAEGGHLAVLQWARGNGCPWDRAKCLELVPAFLSGRAPRGGALVEFEVPEDKEYTCSICEGDVLAGSALFGCRAEEFDVCKKCYAGSEMRGWIQAQSA